MDDQDSLIAKVSATAGHYTVRFGLDRKLNRTETNWFSQIRTERNPKFRTKPNRTENFRFGSVWFGLFRLFSVSTLQFSHIRNSHSVNITFNIIKFSKIIKPQHIINRKKIIITNQQSHGFQNHHFPTTKQGLHMGFPYQHF